MTGTNYNDTTLRLDPADIEVGERIGFFHPDKAAALGRLIAVDGQRDPIKVVRNKGKKGLAWRLVAGMHRLEGVKLEGLPSVWAIEVFGNAEDLADLESSENLHRRPLAPIERAKFVHALCEAAALRVARENGDVKQQAAAAKARWDKVKSREIRADQALKEETEHAVRQNVAAYGWQESTADALGMDARTIQRALYLYRLVIEPFPDLIRALADHPVVGENAAQLKLIADVKDEAARRSVIELLLGDGELSADEARVSAGIDRPEGPAPLPHQKYLNAVVGNLSRLAAPVQKRHLPEIIGALKSDEVKRIMRDMLNQALGDGGAAQGAALTPAVAIRASVKADYIACLEDGTRHTNLSMHLRRLGMTPDEYRARWNLPRDYPMLAPNYSDSRRTAWRKRVALARSARPKAGAGE